MDSIINLNSRQELYQRNQAIAHQWYLAIASVGGFQLDRTEAFEKFSRLTDQVIEFLLSKNPNRLTAQAIGASLADLPCLDPLAIEISGQLWAGQLLEGVFQGEPAIIHPRFLTLINGMATGFAARARAIVLDQQEDIRAAMAADLLRTSEELRKYQSSLEEMLAERTVELRDSEEQFQVIADTSMEGIYQSIDEPKPGTIIYVNNAFTKMLGYTKEELLGKSTLSILADADLQKMAPISQDLIANSPSEGEFRLKHKDGHLVDVQFNVVPTVLKGRVIRSGLVQDITEQKKAVAALFQSEERYRTLAEASPDMIYIIDQNDRIQYLNSFAAALLDLPPQEIIGQPRSNFFHSPDNDYQKKHFQRVFKNGKKYYSEAEAKINNHSIWLGTWLVPILDATGNISAIMAVSRDITEQKQAEMEIRRSRDQLEKRVEERTAELVTSQSQLRQLSNQLVTALEEERHRISRELHDEAGQALISLKYGLASIESDLPESNLHTRKHLKDLMGTIDHVMFQIRTLTRSLRPPVLEIVGIDLSLKDYCAEFTKRTGLSIRYQGEEIPGLPDEIGISLYRFVQEALTNILKHAQATKVEVSLKYSRKQIALTISDNGSGMEEAPRSGGIGLIGIKERLGILGGSLQINSRKDQGVKITAFVPWPRAE